jgi:hypothetical protein
MSRTAGCHATHEEPSLLQGAYRIALLERDATSP